MEFPLFNHSRSPFPLLTPEPITPSILQSILRTEPLLKQLTAEVRSNPADQRLKLKLGGTCLGGPYCPLQPGDDHGRAVPSHNLADCKGYRNTQHIDWQARTGLVLIDIDDTPDPRWVQFYLEHAVPAVASVWVSARGGGVKVGVLTSPIPSNADDGYDAWMTSYAHIVEMLRQAGMTEGVDYKIDSTPAASQMAILAHDPRGMAREPDEEAAVRWEPGDRTAKKPEGSLIMDDGALRELVAASKTAQETAALLPWTVGTRSRSMHRLGVWTATAGVDWREGRAVASERAEASGLVRDYGEWASLRQFDRGWEWGSESLSIFGYEKSDESEEGQA